MSKTKEAVFIMDFEFLDQFLYSKDVFDVHLNLMAKMKVEFVNKSKDWAFSDTYKAKLTIRENLRKKPLSGIVNSKG